MRRFGRVTSVGTVLMVLIGAAIFLGFLIGQPVLLSYVETGSMEPTIKTGHGFVVAPAVITDDPEPGDIIVFDAQELGGGRLTTHRIVENTDSGYITQGDANPTIDQKAGEPPVTDAQIVAIAVEFGDNPITVPHVGTVIDTVQTIFAPLSDSINSSSSSSIGFPTLLFSIGGLAIILGVLFEPGKRDRNRQKRTRSHPGTDVRVIVGTVILITVVVATVAMLGPAGTVQFSLIITEGPAVDDPLVVQVGETTTVTHSSGNDGLFPTLVILEAGDNVQISDHTSIVGPRGNVETAVALEAPDESGRDARYVTENRYLLVLPPSLLVAFHNIHPFAAVAAVDIVIALSVLLVSLLCFDRGRLMLRHRKRSLPTMLRLWRWLL